MSTSCSLSTHLHGVRAQHSTHRTCFSNAKLPKLTLLKFLTEAGYKGQVLLHREKVFVKLFLQRVRNSPDS